MQGEQHDAHVMRRIAEFEARFGSADFVTETENDE